MLFIHLSHRSYFTTVSFVFNVLCMISGVSVCVYIYYCTDKLQVCLTRTSLYYMYLQQQFLELKKNAMGVIAYCDVVHV